MYIISPDAPGPIHFGMRMVKGPGTLVKSFPRNRFQGSLYLYGLRQCRPAESLELIPGLLKSLKIPSPGGRGSWIVAGNGIGIVWIRHRLISFWVHTFSGNDGPKSRDCHGEKLQGPEKVGKDGLSHSGVQSLIYK